MVRRKDIFWKIVEKFLLLIVEYKILHDFSRFSFNDHSPNMFRDYKITLFQEPHWTATPATATTATTRNYGKKYQLVGLPSTERIEWVLV